MGQRREYLRDLLDEVVAIGALQVGKVLLVPTLVFLRSLLDLLFLLGYCEIKNAYLSYPVGIVEIRNRVSASALRVFGSVRG